MKLLFDENISYKIIKSLDPVFEKCDHVKSINATPKNDSEIWDYEKKNNFTIVSFDEDFYEWMLIKGFLPKVIWLRCGNTSKEYIANLLNYKRSEIKEFIFNDEIGLLELR